MKPIPAHDYLWNPDKHLAMPVCVVYGNDSFLRSAAVRHIRDQVLAGEDAEFSLSHFETGDVAFIDVLKELQTGAMFGGGRRVVRVDEADKFVSQNRSELEKYVEKPSEQAVLILQLKSFDAKTNLYKKVAASGLIIEAGAISEGELPQWVVKWAKHRYQTSCELVAAKMIVERVGAEHGDKRRGNTEGTCGLLDQELARLSLLVTDAKKGITIELVEQAVGSWRFRTAFDMLNLALDGKTAEAIQQLNSLIWGGADTVGILGQISSSLQKLATATELILDAERRGSKMSVREALEQVGVKGYFLSDTEARLRNLGRHRGAKLAKWLLQLNLALLGDSKSDRRVLLEKFIVNLSSKKLRERV